MTRTSPHRFVRSFVGVLVASSAVLSLAACSSTGSAKPSAATQQELDGLKARVAEYTKGDATIAANLKTFDTLDFDVFSSQKWDRLKESHAADVKVVWPDGHFTTGIDKHIEDLKQLFVHAPDTRIKEHLFLDNATYAKQIGLS